MPGFPHRALFDRQAYRYLDGADRTDLAWEWLRRIPDYGLLAPGTHRWTEHGWIVDPAPAEITARWGCLYIADARLCWRDARSEEHTSELQSLMRISYAVFCL